jgi:hypothetical protein
MDHQSKTQTRDRDVKRHGTIGSFASGCNLHEYGVCPFAICCAGGAADLSELWHELWHAALDDDRMRPVMAETSFRWVQGHWLQGR